MPNFDPFLGVGVRWRTSTANGANGDGEELAGALRALRAMVRPDDPGVVPAARVRAQRPRGEVFFMFCVVGRGGGRLTGEGEFASSKGG